MIPAIIALGAGLDVASQGAMNTYNHVVALWTAAESMGGAFNTTMGKVFGLKTVLQNAQDAANPGVYELLGSVINDCKEQFGDLAGAGLQVVHMFDEFAARITVDLRGSLGSETQGLLSNMVPDLQEIGQVFGNLGHAILNFALGHAGTGRGTAQDRGRPLRGDPVAVVAAALAHRGRDGHGGVLPAGVAWRPRSSPGSACCCRGWPGHRWASPPACSPG